MGDVPGILDSFGAFIGDNGFPILIALALLGLVALMVWRDRGTSVHQELMRPETSAEQEQAKALRAIAKNTECLTDIERNLERINDQAVHLTYALKQRRTDTGK